MNEFKRKKLICFSLYWNFTVLPYLILTARSTICFFQLDCSLSSNSTNAGDINYTTINIKIQNCIKGIFYPHPLVSSHPHSHPVLITPSFSSSVLITPSISSSVLITPSFSSSVTYKNSKTYKAGRFTCFADRCCEFQGNIWRFNFPIVQPPTF